MNSDAGTPPESWEDADLDACVRNLMLSSASKNGSRNPSPSSSSAFNGQPDVGTEPSSDLVNSVDQFLQEALQNPRERVSVLRIEQEIEKFVRDPNRQETEFHQLPTSYLRLAAHRVAQHYSLQSIPDGSRIIVRKTAEYCRLPPIRLADIPLALPAENSGTVKPVAIKPRPQKGSKGSSSHLPNSNALKSVEEREEEYNKARARIFNSDSNFSESGKEANIEKEPNNNRVAILRDREVDGKDPDYDRNYGRYVQRFDPGFGFCNIGGYPIQPMYAPTINYNTEFPELGYAASRLPEPYWTSPSPYISGTGYGIPEAMMAPFSPNHYVGARSNNDL